MKNQLKQFLPQRNTLCTSLSFHDLSTHLNVSTSVVVMSKHLITLSRHPVLCITQSRPQTLKQFVKVSSPFPFSMLFLTPKCFTFVNIEWGSGVFQGIVAAVVAASLLGLCSTGVQADGLASAASVAVTSRRNNFFKGLLIQLCLPLLEITSTTAPRTRPSLPG